MSEQTCKMCGCTNDDCRQCIAITGKPCHWVEPDLCSACAESIKYSPKKDNMNFFEQLASTGPVDITLRIMSDKTGKLTMNVMPGSVKSLQKPMNITGTPQELDTEFFQTIFPQVQEITGIVTNLKDVKEEAETKAKKRESHKNPQPIKKAAGKKSAAKKARGKAVDKGEEQPAVEEASLFNQAPDEAATEE